MKIFFAVFVCLCFTSCITNNPESPQSKELLIVGRIGQSCPVAVKCDETFDYHAYSGEVDSLKLYLSFNPSIVTNKSPENILSAFHYLYFKFSFPSLNTDSSTVFVFSPTLYGRMSDTSGYKSEVIKFENGKLYGRLSFPVQELVEEIHSKSESCFTGDMLGICRKTRKLNVPIHYVINYELELQE